MAQYTLWHNNLEATLGGRVGVGKGEGFVLDVTKSESALHQESPTDSMRQGARCFNNNNMMMMMMMMMDKSAFQLMLS